MDEEKAKSQRTNRGDSEASSSAKEIIAGIILGTVATCLFEAGLQICGFVCSFFVILLGVFVLIHHLQKTRLKKSAKKIRGFLIGANVLLFSFLIRSAYFTEHLGKDISTRSPPEELSPFAPLKVVRMKSLNRSTEDVAFLFGTNSLLLPPVAEGVTNEMDIFESFGISGSRTRLEITHDKIFLKGEFMPFPGMKPLRLIPNELSDLPDNWDCNYNDNSIEIVNEDLVPIFQLYYRGPNTLVFYGVITLPSGVIFSSDAGCEVWLRPNKKEGVLVLKNPTSGHVLVGSVNSPARSKITFVWNSFEWNPTEKYTNEVKDISAKDVLAHLKILNLKRHFKYPSSQYLGVLANN